VLTRPRTRSPATSELAHLFRALKAPATARTLPKLAERARAEDDEVRVVNTLSCAFEITAGADSSSAMRA
jgi:hypothetical protein